MTQPPAGGYPPPPDSSGGIPPTGGQQVPPPGPNGPPSGGYPAAPPPGSYPPPPSGPPTGYPPAPGAGQPAPGAYPPPQGGYPPPPGGGYPGQPPAGQPQGGYAPPPQGGYPPPGYGQPAPAAAGPSFDMSKVSVGDWIVLGIGVLLIIFGTFGWISSSGTYGGSVGGWHIWWIVIQLLLLAVVIIRAVQIFTGQLVQQIPVVYLVYAAVLLFVLYVIALIQIFAQYSYSAADTIADACSGLEGASKTACEAAANSYASNISVGPGFGIWACLILSIAFVYFLALSAQKAGAKLPMKIPGPNL